MAANSKRGPAVVAVLALLGVAFGIWSLGGDAPEEADRVRETIRAVVVGAERADLKAVMTPISQAYRDDVGMSRDNIKGYLFMEFRRRGPVHTMLGPIEVSLDEDGQGALAVFNLALGEGGAGVVGELLPQSGDVFTFEVDLAREGDDWRIVSHERFTLEGDRVRLPRD
jgi:hypothetical protein